MFGSRGRIDRSAANIRNGRMEENAHGNEVGVMLKNGWFIDQNGKAYKVYADNDGGLWYYSEDGTVVVLK